MKVPHAEHREALDHVLADWGGMARAVHELPNATRASLKAALKQPDHGFTHVHLLAHGVPPSRNEDDPTALVDLTKPPPPSTLLALEDGEGVIDRCLPDWFESLFDDGVPRPATFALATCCSAEVHSIESRGTMAHVLHAAGVPIVLATQVELTKAGSGALVDTFLRDVVNGEDPRIALRACRKKMREAQDQTFYDRVALVGYVHVDAGLEARLRERRFKVALARLRSASRDADDKLTAFTSQPSGGEKDQAARHDEIEAIRQRFESVRRQLELLKSDAGLSEEQREELRGLQGSSLKREAEAAWKLSRKSSGSEATRWLHHSRERLLEAKKAYAHAASTSLDRHWSPVQWLALVAITEGSLAAHETDWIIARRATQNAIGLAATPGASDAEKEEAMWAQGSLCELYLLASLAGRPAAAAQAKACLSELARLAHARSMVFAITSTLDQLARYDSWWGADNAWPLPDTVVDAARQLHQHLSTLLETPGPGGATSMLTIEMLPANEGDALWIEYGADPVRRVLIDCGRRTAYRAVADRLDEEGELAFELLVLTHVDADHITGAVPLLRDERFGPARVGDVWFNGWRHLNGLHRDADNVPGTLSAKQGEFFGAVLRDGGYPWNEHFAGHAAVIAADGPLPEVTLPGGLTLTLLGPTRAKLDDMRERWREDLDVNDPAKRIDPGDFERALQILEDDRTHRPDTLSDGPIDVDDLVDIPFDADHSEPNGSSISFLAEFGGKAVLFAGDAHAPQLVAAIRRLLASRGQDVLRLDALKMSHHGSARNNSPELLGLLDCRRYLVSTSGSRHHHPDAAALARVLVENEAGVEFHFNYRSEETEVWDDDALRARHGYQTFYPDGDDGLMVTL